MLDLGLAEPGSEVVALSKPTMTDLGGLPLTRAMADSMAAALALSGLVVATNRAQQCAHVKLYTPQCGLVKAVWHCVHCVH